MTVAHRSPTGVPGRPYSLRAQRGRVAKASSVSPGMTGLNGRRSGGSGVLSDWRSGWVASGTNRRPGRHASM
nr:hypothetical protein GCM10020093_114520 [Planobispora longispora]